MGITENGGFENYNEEEQENKGKDAKGTLKLCAKVAKRIVLQCTQYCSFGSVYDSHNYGYTLHNYLPCIGYLKSIVLSCIKTGGKKEVFIKQ